ncbi:hypothetical protein [Sphingobacterium siyangense]|nr:hypothetical protein [Sphingobacterium siyangense]
MIGKDFYSGIKSNSPINKWGGYDSWIEEEKDFSCLFKLKNSNLANTINIRENGTFNLKTILKRPCQDVHEYINRPIYAGEMARISFKKQHIVWSSELIIFLLDKSKLKWISLNLKKKQIIKISIDRKKFIKIDAFLRLTFSRYIEPCPLTTESWYSQFFTIKSYESFLQVLHLISERIKYTTDKDITDILYTGINSYANLTTY